MNAEQMLTFHLTLYKNMCRELGKDDQRVVEAFGKLRDLVIAEIYFMRSLRYIIDDEEMSGFIIYINGDIRSIVDAYVQSRGPFLTYLKEIMERRAVSYLKDMMRKLNFQKAYISYQKTCSMAVAEASAEEVYCLKEEEVENRDERRSLLKALRCFCGLNPSRVKKLFIFLCTLMPFLSVDVLDRFCLALNCDRRQTKAISKYLDEVQKNNDRSRASKAYMARMTDYHWSKILENEGNAHFLNDAKSKNAAAFHREKLKIVLEGSKAAKMNVPYRIIGKLMHLDPVTVGLYVLHSKHILERIINRPPKGLDKKNVNLPRFEPFREFGIETLNKPA